MSQKYDEYLIKHGENVKRAWKWMQAHLTFNDISSGGWYMYFLISNHDKSKHDAEEYAAYDEYFYGERSGDAVEQMNLAWLHHIHHNPHHWQHWILHEDDGKMIALEMPYCHILEMVADWFSFSIEQDKPHELFDWYDAHKDKMILHPNTRVNVERILGEMRENL